MAVYRKNPSRSATLTSGQRTSLGSLLSAIFPGVALADVVDCHFYRAPGGNVQCIINDRTVITNLNQLASGDPIEVE